MRCSHLATWLRRRALDLVALAALSLAAAPSQAALVQINGGGANGLFASSNDCVHIAFPNCWATQTGIIAGPVQNITTESPSIFRYNSDGAPEINTELFPTITGSEFVISFDITTNVLSFTYTPGTGDPTIHYFVAKQGHDFALFYDSNAILSGAVDMDLYFAQPGGYSHMTFFDTGVPPCRSGIPCGSNPGNDIPEPASLGVLGLGLVGLGMISRRRRVL